MLTNNFIFSGVKILSELIRDILYFPLWWYSAGLARLLLSLKNFLADKEKSLALSVWVKNIFTPMYGQYDWAGMIISFFVRLFQIIIRGLLMLFWLAVALAVFLLWLGLPVAVVYEIYFQIK